MSMKFIVIAVVYVLVATTAVSAMPIGTSPIVSHNIESYPNSDGVGKLEARTPGFGSGAYSRVPTNDPEPESHELQTQKHDDHGHASNACVPTANPSQTKGNCECPSVCNCDSTLPTHVADQAGESSKQHGQVVGGQASISPGSHTNQNVSQPGRMSTTGQGVGTPPACGCPTHHTGNSEQDSAARTGYIRAQTMSMLGQYQKQQDERTRAAENTGCAYGCMCGLATGIGLGACVAHFCL